MCFRCLVGGGLDFDVFGDVEEVFGKLIVQEIKVKNVSIFRLIL